MALANVPLDVYQGEDWSAQIIVTDQNNETVSLVRPMQMDIVNVFGELMLSLTVPLSGTDGVIPEIDFSPDIGLIQLHIARAVTAALPAGTYSYDLFASVSDGAAYAGNQRIAVLNGSFNVSKRITEMA